MLLRLSVLGRLSASGRVRYERFHCIDDLLTLNNNSFEEEIINIYPPELTLKKTTESNSRI